MFAEAPGREPRPPDRSWTKPERRRRGAMSLGQGALILGVVALALGGSGLAVALTHAGPAGSTGATGPTGPTGSTGAPGPEGPPGPGAVVESTYTTSGSGVLSDTCSNYADSAVSLTVSSAGTVVVSASVGLYVYHTSSEEDEVYSSLWNQATTCDVLDNNYVLIVAETTQATGAYVWDLNLVQSFTVTTGGTYTFSVIAEAAVYSSDSANFYSASVVGVFYPS